MTRVLPSTRYVFFGRYLAIMSICILLSGRILHSHQHCSDCCHHSASEQDFAGSCCARQLDQAVSHNCPKRNGGQCPFGNAQSEGEDHLTQDAVPLHPASPDSEPDQHGCAVCSVLSQAPEVAVPVGVISVARQVEAVHVFRHAVAIAGAFLLPQPRGPPSLT